jgi:hypothetical protein
MDNDGRVAFIASLALGVGGVDRSNNFGIWVGTSEENLRLLVRSGQIIGGKPLPCLPQDSGHLQMNELGLLWMGGCRGAFSPNGPIVVSRFED